MTADAKLEVRLTELFNSTASGRAPDDLHAMAMTRVAGVGQRPAVLARLRGERLGRPVGATSRATRIVVAVAALILLAMVAALAAGALRSTTSGTITYVSWDPATSDASLPPTPSIWRVGVDGTGDQRIATGECPSVSADGGSMVFLSGRVGDQKGQMIAANGDGSGQRPLAGVDTFRAAISPDGSVVAWVKDLRPIATADGATQFGYEGEIWVTPLSGGPGFPLVAHTAPGVSFSDLAWSPSGDRIAFIETKVVSGAGANADITAEGSIWVINADGSSPRPLAIASQSTVWSQRLGHTRYNAIWPVPISWSPDGRSLAYVRKTDSNDQLTVLAADGSRETRIAASGFGATALGATAWSPNGKYLAYQSMHGLTTVEIVGGSPTGPQHPAPASTVEPIVADIGAWSPDSGQLLIIETRQANSGRAVTSDPSRLLLIDPELTGPPRLVIERDRRIGDDNGCPATWSNP